MPLIVVELVETKKNGDEMILLVDLLRGDVDLWKFFGLDPAGFPEPLDH